MIYKDMLQPYPHLTEDAEEGLQRVLEAGNHVLLIEEDLFLENFMVSKHEVDSRARMIWAHSISQFYLPRFIGTVTASWIIQC